jgi:hypothetical protein
MISVILRQRISSGRGIALMGYLDCVLLSGSSSSALRFERNSCHPSMCQGALLRRRLWPCQLGRN